MSENAFSWSVTASSNDVADAAVPWPEGMLPGAVNNSARALMAGVARYIADTNGSITTGGGSNIYTVTSLSDHSTLTNGIVVAAKASFTNTGAATLNLNTIGAKSIRVFSSGAEGPLVAGQIVINGTYQFRYDTAADSAAGGWILLNPTQDPARETKIGEIKMWGSGAPPAAYLFCNGAAVSRTTYATLFGVISTFFGAGDGSTTFNVPDLRGRAPFGQDDMGASAASRITNAGSGIVGTTLSASGGAETVTLDTTMIPSHSHTGTTDNGGVAHTHSGTTNSQDANHTHGVAPGTPSTTNGTFTGPGGTGWGGAVGTATTGIESGAHSHPFTTGAASATNHTHTFTTGTTGGGLAHRNMPPALIVQFIIKAL